MVGESSDHDWICRLNIEISIRYVQELDFQGIQSSPPSSHLGLLQSTASFFPEDRQNSYSST